MKENHVLLVLGCSAVKKNTNWKTQYNNSHLDPPGNIKQFRINLLKKKTQKHGIRFSQFFSLESGQKREEKKITKNKNEEIEINKIIINDDWNVKQRLLDFYKQPNWQTALQQPGLLKVWCIHL